ncbi:aldo/keto reductase [Streptomyces sp. NPDC020875]|uniref:aldo/keto reductase n=1 Tax=Streptomyces sp. NPDC020875 TaxID=3154898 RepID=UPI0033F1CFE2
MPAWPDRWPGARIGVHCTLPDTWPGDTRDDIRLLNGLREAVERGVRFFDTADSCGDGHGERLLGRLLREYPDAGLEMGSKVGTLRGTAPHPYAGPRVRLQFQQTLENLYVERLALHTLASLDFGPGGRYLGCVADQMRVLREMELVGAVGLVAPDPGAARPADGPGFVQVFDAVRPEVIWCRLTALTPLVRAGGEDLLAFARRHGVGLVLAPPGLPRSAVLPGPSPEAAGWGVLRERFGDGPGELEGAVLRYCLARVPGSVAVLEIGTRVPLGEPLSGADLLLLDETYGALRSAVADRDQAAARAGAPW